MQLPDLGVIETALSQRNRHRKALIRFLYDSYQVTQLLICINPAEFECIQDFCTDTASTRLLEINPDLSNLALTNHAKSLDLISAKSPKTALTRLLPQLRADIQGERARLTDAGFDSHYRIAERNDITDTEHALSQFLAAPEQTVRDLNLAANLFSNEDAHAL